MFEFLKSKHFHVIGSFIVGLGLAAILRPGCRGNCTVHKAPAVEEVTKSTYQLGSKCYQFKTEPTACAESGMVEALTMARA